MLSYCIISKLHLSMNIQVYTHMHVFIFDLLKEKHQTLNRVNVLRSFEWKYFPEVLAPQLLF